MDLSAIPVASNSIVRASKDEYAAKLKALIEVHPDGAIPFAEIVSAGFPASSLKYSSYWRKEGVGNASLALVDATLVGRLDNKTSTLRIFRKA
jgi:hypothetical protein